MPELLLAVGFAIGISAFCSIAEATLYSVPLSRIEQLREAGRRSGRILHALRQDVEKPIAAILTLNTVANTAGAAIAGAAASRVFGTESLGFFAAAFTVAILLFSEILPKTIGVMYTRSLAPVLAAPIAWMVTALHPVVWLLGLISGLLERKTKQPEATEDDIRAMVSMTRRAGILKAHEEKSITNILALDDRIVREIITPRTVLFSLPADISIRQAHESKEKWPYSRMPVYEADNEDIVGIVYRRDIFEALVRSTADGNDINISDLMKPAHFVVDTLALDKLLLQFLESRLHLFIVLDEYGGVSGVVTLEDVLEEILGKEIVDETDQVTDMRILARQQRARLSRSREVK